MFDYTNVIDQIWSSDPAVRSHPLNRGKVAWWLALPGRDGGRQLYDLIGSNHGTLTNMTTAASGWRGTTRPGGWGHILFDGTDDYVNLGSNPAWSFGAGDFTLAASFLSTDPAGFHVLIGKDDPASRQWIFAQSALTPGKLSFVSEVNSAYSTTGGTSIVAGAWYRALFTRRGTACSLYINGVLDGTQNDPSIYSGTSETDIGRRAYPGYEQPWSGAIDDIAAWTRGFSDAEARADYDQSRLGYPGVLRRWPGARAVMPKTTTPIGKVPWHLFFQRSI